MRIAALKKFYTKPDHHSFFADNSGGEEDPTRNVLYSLAKLDMAALRKLVVMMTRACRAKTKWLLQATLLAGCCCDKWSGSVTGSGCSGSGCSGS